MIAVAAWIAVGVATGMVDRRRYGGRNMVACIIGWPLHWTMWTRDRFARWSVFVVNFDESSYHVGPFWSERAAVRHSRRMYYTLDPDRWKMRSPSRWPR